VFDPNLGYDPVLIGQRPKRLMSDGTIIIMCRICEKPISREAYRGFSTATCAVCYGEMEKGRTPQEIMADVQQAEKRQLHDLYNDLPQGFRAHGFGARVKEVIQKVKIAAEKRRRSPLFSKKDKI
jgi:hypothetical protein